MGPGGLYLPTYLPSCCFLYLYWLDRHAYMYLFEFLGEGGRRTGKHSVGLASHSWPGLEQDFGTGFSLFLNSSWLTCTLVSCHALLNVYFSAFQPCRCGQAM